MIAGARVEVAPYKKNAMDFVLWKPSDANDARLGFALGPRPSRLAYRMLGHGRANIWARPSTSMAAASTCNFPHHENEIAQSEGAHHDHPLAKVWMHNGFLQVEGEKMSKSAGNFFTIRDLLADWPGEVLRFNMLRTHYRQPIDFTIAGLKESWKTLERWYEVTEPLADPAPDAEFFAALSDDLNTPAAIASLHQADEMALAGGLGFLGFSNVQLKIASKAKVDDSGHRRRHRRAQRRAQGQELRGKRPHPRRSAGQGHRLEGRAAGHDLGSQEDDHRERLYHLRHHPARRGADPGRGFLGRGQAPDRAGA